MSGSILLCCVASLAIWLASVLAVEKGRNESGWLNNNFLGRFLLPFIVFCWLHISVC